MNPTLKEIETIARGAGAILRDGFGKEHTIGHKGAIDLVTEVDHLSEAFILKAIRERYSDHHILTEESGTLAGDRDHCWYIDPLDGTVNYAHSLPIFAVSMAYAWRGELRAGVIYDPLRDECFSAEKGAGARLNGEPIRVSGVSALIESLLVTGFPYDRGALEKRTLETYGRFQRLTRGVRRLGSAALDLAYVAAGRLDGFWELRLNAWDTAAGGLLVREAGGLVTDLDGGPNFLQPPGSILAANPALHPLMLAILSES